MEQQSFTPRQLRLVVRAREFKELPILPISVAAELACMHPQTLRQYDRLGLVVPARTGGAGRRYSFRDVEKLGEVQRLSQEEGINLAGITRILKLEQRVEQLEAQVAEMRLRTGGRIFAATATGETVALSRGQRAQARESSRALILYRG